MSTAQTLQLLLGDLSADELERLLTVMREFRGRFAFVAKEIIGRAAAANLDDRVARSAVVAECLLLAACMHRGEINEFLLAAKAAVGTATDLAAAMPKTGTLN